MCGETGRRSLRVHTGRFESNSRTSKRLLYSFSRSNVYENTDLSVRIQLQKCKTEIMETLVQEN